LRLTSAAAATGGGAHPLRSGLCFACCEEFESPARGLAVCLPGSSCQPRLASPDSRPRPTLVTLATPAFSAHIAAAQSILPPFSAPEQVLSTHSAGLAPTRRALRDELRDGQPQSAFVPSMSVVRSVGSVARRRPRLTHPGSTPPTRVGGVCAGEGRSAPRRSLGTADDRPRSGRTRRTGCAPAAPAGIIVRPRTVARLSWAHHISSDQWAGNGFRPWKISRAWTIST
jgi:hypothetical protein